LVLLAAGGLRVARVAFGRPKVAEELINERLLKRSHGMLELFGYGAVARFLKHAIPREKIETWEKEGAGSRRGLIAGAEAS